MTARLNLRDSVNRFVPSWLSDHHPIGPSWGYRLLWGVVLLIDAAIEVAAQGSLAAVGKATPTALDYIGDARGLIRNQDESDEDYARRLATWVDRARENGSAYRLPLAIHDYLRSHPRIRVFRRNGECLTVDTDRTITRHESTAWDWDSVSHPERAGWWSDIWIVVYTTSGTSTQWEHRPGGLGDLTGDRTYALGHLAKMAEVDAIKGLVQLCKAAHTCVRAIIWTSDESLFDPEEPTSMPDGTWGAWSINVGGSQVVARNTTTCRYWEPR